MWYHSERIARDKICHIVNGHAEYTGKIEIIKYKPKYYFKIFNFYI